MKSWCILFSIRSRIIFALGFSLGRVPDWLLVSEAGDALTGVLQQVYTSAQNAGVGVNTLMVEGHPTTALARLMLSQNPAGTQNTSIDVIAQVLGMQAQVDDVSVMTSSPALMVSTLKNGQNAPQLPAWTQDLSLFRTPNEGYMHLRWPQLQSELSQRSARFRLWETATKPILRHLKNSNANQLRADSRLANRSSIFPTQQFMTHYALTWSSDPIKSGNGWPAAVVRAVAGTNRLGDGGPSTGGDLGNYSPDRC